MHQKCMAVLRLKNVVLNDNHSCRAIQFGENQTTRSSEADSSRLGCIGINDLTGAEMPLSFLAICDTIIEKYIIGVNKNGKSNNKYDDRKSGKAYS